MLFIATCQGWKGDAGTATTDTARLHLPNKEASALTVFICLPGRAAFFF
jgi:hypothetical protein